MGGAFAAVARLAGVGLEVEELGAVADVVNVLPAAVAHHVHAGGGADGVVFAEDDPGTSGITPPPPAA